MANSFEDFDEQVRNHPCSLLAAEAIHNLAGAELAADADWMDPATLMHTVRVARMVNVLSWEAGIILSHNGPGAVPLEIAIALHVGAITHDAGRADAACRKITASSEPLTDMTRSVVILHPTKSRQYTQQIFADQAGEYIPSAAATFAGGHHSHYQNAARNYSTADMLGLNVRERKILRLFGPVLSIADGFEALTTTTGRGYRTARFAQDGGTVIRPGDDGFFDAAQLVIGTDLVRLDQRYQNRLSPKRVAEVLLRRKSYIDGDVVVITT